MAIHCAAPRRGPPSLISAPPFPLFVLLVLDNGSEFTPEIASALDAASVPFVSRAAADPGAWDAAVSAGSYILSGRRRNDRAMNALNSRIIRHAASSRRPLLGICYGAEMLALSSGGTIRRMQGGPHRGTEIVEVERGSPLCPAGAAVRVREQHRYEIARLGCLARLGGSARCANELVRLGDTHAYGAQFHPEMTADGRRMLERFAALKGY